MFSARHEFSNEWYRFLHPTDMATDQTLLLDLTMERFPFQLRGKTLLIDAVNLFLKLKGGFTYDDGKALAFVLKKEDGTELPASLFKIAGSPITNLPYAEPLQGQSGDLGKWSLEIKEDDVKKFDAALRQTVKVNGRDRTRLNPDAIKDLVVVCQYSVQ